MTFVVITIVQMNYRKNAEDEISRDEGKNIG